MDYRCPHAAFVGTAVLRGWRLMFKGSKSGNYATIERERGCKVPVVLWDIDQLDEFYLDRYEGYPSFYYKTEIYIPWRGWGMAYIMHENRLLGAPTRHYYTVLDNAYQRFLFDRKILQEALAYSKKKPA